jgi:hypothetical protein
LDRIHPFSGLVELFLESVDGLLQSLGLGGAPRSSHVSRGSVGSELTALSFHPSHRIREPFLDLSGEVTGSHCDQVPNRLTKMFRAALQVLSSSATIAKGCK